MKKIYFEYFNNTTALSTRCPYNILYGTPSVYSSACGKCDYYNGKFKNENAIQCSGDENRNIKLEKSKLVYGFEKELIKPKTKMSEKVVILDRFLLIEKRMELNYMTSRYGIDMDTIKAIFF
jgi:hypothetical protein